MHATNTVLLPSMCLSGLSCSPSLFSHVGSGLQGDHEIMPNSDSEGAESVATERQNGSDSGGENVANVNHICQHEACAAQTTCMIAELETIRNNYTKGRDQFQIKVSFLPCMEKRHTILSQFCMRRSTLNKLHDSFVNLYLSWRLAELVFVPFIIAWLELNGNRSIVSRKL